MQGTMQRMKGREVRLEGSKRGKVAEASLFEGDRGGALMSMMSTFDQR